MNISNPIFSLLISSMNPQIFLMVGVVLIPLCWGLFSFFYPFKTVKTPLRILLLGTIFSSVLIFSLIFPIISAENPTSLQALNNYLQVDSLSAYHLLIMILVFTLSSIYAQVYFRDLSPAGKITKLTMSRFTGLWGLTLSAMTLVLISNHLILMWFSLESTTLATTFLICTDRHQRSVEAMWKYLIICSVGLSIALIGTILFGYAAYSGSTIHNLEEIWQWTTLAQHSIPIIPPLAKIGFIFVVVGYGTKAGLAPMHTWLPDAHGEAPTPVSAIFSGFMLSLAIYCIMRFIPIVAKTTTGNSWPLSVLTAVGIISIVIATSFIAHQKHLKRLFAYSSVEHMGIISLGLGLGPLGQLAALFHTLNHSLSKILAFFAAGIMGKIFSTQEISKIRDSIRLSPLWGSALLIAILAIIGMAPFSIFMSELQLVKAAINNHAWWSLAIFLIATSIIFISALKIVISISWSKDDHISLIENESSTSASSLSLAGNYKLYLSDYLLVSVIISIILWLGISTPLVLLKLLTNASKIIMN